MVEGHLREEVVAHVGVRDVVQRVVQQRPEGSVYCAQGASQPAPLLPAEVRHEHVGVL